MDTFLPWLAVTAATGQPESPIAGQPRNLVCPQR